MKKVINGKVYDTDKARELGVDAFGGAGDFRHWCERLYVKRTGEFFLHGEGGPLTQYAERVDGGWTGGDRIIPLAYDQARQWVEEHLSADQYEEIFGTVSEDAEDVHLHLKVSAETAARLRRIAGEQGISVTAALEQLISRA